ncbi:MAG: hypothetical protein LWX11_04775, partial [Firmicutes bacterium]|nr:hypothetical protein [Bacillota bacterium]
MDFHGLDGASPMEQMRAPFASQNQVWLLNGAAIAQQRFQAHRSTAMNQHGNLTEGESETTWRKGPCLALTMYIHQVHPRSLLSEHRGQG